MAINRVQPGDDITAEGYNQLVDAANANAYFESPDFNFVDSAKGKTFTKRNDNKNNKLEVPRPFDCRLTCNADNEVFFQVFDPLEHAYMFGELPDQNHWWIWDGTQGKKITIPADYNITKLLTLSGGTSDEWEGVQLLMLSCANDTPSLSDDFIAGCMFADITYRDISRDVTCEGAGQCKVMNPELILCSYKLHTKNQATGESNSFRIINCGGGEVRYGTGADLSSDNMPIPDTVAVDKTAVPLSSIWYPGKNESQEDETPIFSLFEFEKRDNQLDISAIKAQDEEDRGDFLYREHSKENLGESLRYLKFNDVYSIPDTQLCSYLSAPQNSIEEANVRGLRMRQIYGFDKLSAYSNVLSAKAAYPDGQHVLFRGVKGDAAEVSYVDLSGVVLPDAEELDPKDPHMSIDKEGYNNALQLYKFKDDENKDYFDGNAIFQLDDIVIRHVDENVNTRVDYVPLREIAHFADNETKLDVGYENEKLSSTEVYLTPNTQERIIRIHGFKDEKTVDISALKYGIPYSDAVDAAALIRYEDPNGKRVRYVSLSSICPVCDTSWSYDVGFGTQFSIQDRYEAEEGIIVRQLYAFDDIDGAESQIGFDYKIHTDINDLSSSNSATLLLRNAPYTDSPEKELEYIDLSSVAAKGDSQSEVGLSSIERNDSNGHYYSLFGFGTNGPVAQAINLSSATLSTDIVTRSDKSGLRNVEYTKLSVQYPEGDAHIAEHTLIGSIDGPFMQAKNVAGTNINVPGGYYELNAWNTGLNDISKSDLTAYSETKILLRCKETGIPALNNLQYIDLSALSGDCCADSDVPMEAWGTRSQKSLDKIPHWASLVGQDYYNIYQLHNWNQPEIVTPSDLASSEPTVLTRTVDSFNNMELKYVPLSTLSSLPMDTDISHLSQKSLETKHQNGENWNQLYQFDNPTTATDSEAKNGLFPVRVSSNGQTTLKYASLSSLSAESWPGDADLAYKSRSIQTNNNPDDGPEKYYSLYKWNDRSYYMLSSTLVQNASFIDVCLRDKRNQSSTQLQYVEASTFLQSALSGYSGTFTVATGRQRCSSESGWNIQSEKLSVTFESGVLKEVSDPVWDDGLPTTPLSEEV